jgi:hypothetical protein
VTGRATAARLKLNWARKNLDALNAEVGAFNDRQRRHIRVESNDDRTEYCFYVTAVEQVNPDWPLMVGDVLFDLRSALDHLVYELHAAAFGGNVPSALERSSMFPIFRTRALWKSKGKWRVKKLPIRVQAEVQRLQAYHDSGSNHVGGLLWFLDDVQNFDKHRRLHVVAQVATRVPLDDGPDGPNVETFTVPIQSDALVAKWTFSESQPEGVEMQGHTIVRERFSDGYAWGLLASFADAVETTIERFEVYL